MLDSERSIDFVALRRMAWVPSVLEGLPVGEHGFSVSTTAIFSNADMIDVMRCVDGVVRREYDWSLRTLLVSFGLRDLADLCPPPQNTSEQTNIPLLVATASTDRYACCANFLQTIVTDHRHSTIPRCILSRYLTPVQAVGVLLTGKAHDNVGAQVPMAPMPKRRYQSTDSTSSDILDCLVQYVGSGRQREVIRVKLCERFRSASSPTVFRRGEEVCAIDSNGGAWRMNARRNRYAITDKRFLFEKMATFDAPRALHEHLEISLESSARILRAAQYLIDSLTSRKGQVVLQACLFFVIEESTNRLFFQFAQHVNCHVWGLSSDHFVAPPPFRPPPCYNSFGGRPPRPKLDHFSDEDALREPRLDPTTSPNFYAMPKPPSTAELAKDLAMKRWVLEDLVCEAWDFNLLPQLDLALLTVTHSCPDPADTGKIEKIAHDNGVRLPNEVGNLVPELAAPMEHAVQRQVVQPEHPLQLRNHFLHLVEIFEVLPYLLFSKIATLSTVHWVDAPSHAAGPVIVISPHWHEGTDLIPRFSRAAEEFFRSLGCFWDLLNHPILLANIEHGRMPCTTISDPSWASSNDKPRFIVSRKPCSVELDGRIRSWLRGPLRSLYFEHLEEM